MTEDEALIKYCEMSNYHKCGLTELEMVEFEIETSQTIGFRNYLLSLELKKLVSEMYNSLPKWLRVFLRGKG